jgi:hypothetical protein
MTKTSHTPDARSTCTARWTSNKDDRIRYLRKPFRVYQNGDECEYANELGTFIEYAGRRFSPRPLTGRPDSPI